MSLRSEIVSRPETLADLDVASTLRWREGDILAERSSYSGGVYLLGYVIEMRLKLAAYRLVGAKLFDPADVQRRKVDAWMKRYAPHVAPESGHSVAYWATFIQLYRHSLARPLPAKILRSLRRHVYVVVFNDWKVEMRYRDAKRTSSDMWKIWAAAWWIEENWLSL